MKDSYYKLRIFKCLDFRLYMDYYQTLGISKDASTKEIKTAYRKLAFKYHPDKNKEDHSEDKFKQIVNAYSILSNDDKRKNYDMGNLDGIFSNINFEEIYKSFADMFADFSMSSPQPLQKGNNIEYNINVSLEDVYNKVEKELTVTRKKNLNGIYQNDKTIINIPLYKQTVNKQKLKLKLRLAQIRNETEEKLHQMKLQFFTDISHEFRTPLTLINGPVNRLLKGNDKNTELSRKQLALIKNNTDRLLRLINQFLDFRRINQGNLKLSPINTDVISFCKNVFDCFEELATQQRFNYNFITESTSLKMDFDTDKIDKVLVNILSNAFKNTGDQGNITLKIKRNKKTELKDNWSNYSIGEELHSEFVEISITDSGLGISSENLPKIFERFFQIKYNKQVKASGTGIGLSLTTNYINIHNGQLLVSSLKGVGTTFYIYLPIHQPNTFNELPSAILDIKSFDYNSETNNYNAPEVKNDKIIDNQESLILIAEDNPDLLEFLEDSISNHFRIAKSKNGKEALSLAMSLHPDLIISDIIMPEMDGIELCKRIKQDIRTSHIPVVLLTALSTVQNKISGMQSGADAYVPKPFNEEFLISQIDNLLNSRKTLRSLFASKQEEWDEGVNILNIDKKLIEKAIHTVENNISNYDFTVEDFAKSLNLSRTHLHRKLKSLTNQSATEFIRNIRLKHAIVLMKSGDYRINEIGFAVGFNSHNYFTKAFKRQYGKSPRDFVRDNFKK